MKYFEELKKAMSLLAEHDKTIFIGQAVKYAGTGLYDTLTHIPDESGVVNGMAIQGMIPVSIMPRWNFLLMGTDQIINHLDKFMLLSDGRCTPKAIIRVAVGSERPVDPQDQHKGNFADAFRMMCKTIDVIELHEPEDIVPAYEFALNRTDGKSTILVEFGDYSKEK
jgi:pyruvate/2-oxoglutarate/acetoin dehydrogenase E1 component